ncbi:MAG: alpha-galactosidase [Opitutales bacterium]
MNWRASVLGPGRPQLRIDGRSHPLRAAAASRQCAVWRSAEVALNLAFAAETRHRLRVTASLHHLGRQPVALNQVTLFASRRLGLGPQPAAVRILEQNAYLGRVRTPRQMATGSDQLKATDGTMGAFVSQNVTVLFNPASRAAVLLGFETIDRWLPQICARQAPTRGGPALANVDGATVVAAAVSGATPARIPAFREFTIGFDGGDYRLEPGETLALGEFVLEAGADPLALLDAYGRRLKRRNRLPDPISPLANWCSWYPYRLGVTQERILATARAARARNLHRLGLEILQVDLGWQKDNLPTYFEENERFSRGLGWLGDELRRAGFKLGVWVGALCVAETHPIARDHRDWLLRGADGQPHPAYNWFWAPFTPIYALDVSHPGAQAWLRENFTRLGRQGVRFVKWDFSGVVAEPELRGRHNPRLVNARAREAVRTAFGIAQKALDAAGEQALMIDCSGTDLAAAGIASLVYANLDTGNTGIGWRHLREVYTSFACHLFKHHWALPQPSCLVTGLSGTLEEARIRATATFMGAGHVDLGDDLTTLPEDRWNVVLASLPPNDRPARPVDLFEPIATATLPYLALIKAQPTDQPRLEPDPAGACVWTVPMTADWDEWTLVAIFNWNEPVSEGGSRVNLSRRFQVPFRLLGLPAKEKFWAYEFWSGQFLGEIPQAVPPPGTYRHPGDYMLPILPSGPGLLDLGFHGPAVKLLVLRRPRPHPWPLGTSFHQSGGCELSRVRWNALTRTLSGRLHRPKGESGFITIAVPGAPTPVKLPLLATGNVTHWAIALP